MMHRPGTLFLLLLVMTMMVPAMTTTSTGAPEVVANHHPTDRLAAPRQTPATAEVPFHHKTGGIYPKDHFPHMDLLRTLNDTTHRLTSIAGNPTTTYALFIVHLCYILLAGYVLRKLHLTAPRPPREPSQRSPPLEGIHGFTVTAHEALQPYRPQEMGHLLPGVAALHRRLAKEHERLRAETLAQIITKRQLLKDIALINGLAVERQRQKREEQRLKRQQEQPQARGEGPEDVRGDPEEEEDTE